MLLKMKVSSHRKCTNHRPNTTNTTDEDRKTQISPLVGHHHVTEGIRSDSMGTGEGVGGVRTSDCLTVGGRDRGSSNISVVSLSATLDDSSSSGIPLQLYGDVTGNEPVCCYTDSHNF